MRIRLRLLLMRLLLFSCSFIWVVHHLCFVLVCGFREDLGTYVCIVVTALVVGWGECSGFGIFKVSCSSGGLLTSVYVACVSVIVCVADSAVAVVLAENADEACGSSDGAAGEVDSTAAVGGDIW